MTESQKEFQVVKDQEEDHLRDVWTVLKNSEEPVYEIIATDCMYLCRCDIVSQ